MPELPEVETVVRQLRPRLCGRRIVAFSSSWPKKVSPSARLVAKALRDQRVSNVWRRAKWIVFDLQSNGHLLVHLRMSGRFEWAADHAAPLPHTRAIFRLDDGAALWFVDPRKFGVIRHTRDLAAETADLGMEPLEPGFSAARVRGLLAGRSRRIKPLLLDQTLIAGLGNIYVDEALHAARIHPDTPAAEIDADRVVALVRAIRTTLRQAIARNGSSIDWMYPNGSMQTRLRVYGRTGEACRNCGGRIERLVVAQRGTHICPTCQPAPTGSKRLRQG